MSKILTIYIISKFEKSNHFILFFQIIYKPFQIIFKPLFLSQKIRLNGQNVLPKQGVIYQYHLRTCLEEKQGND